MSTVDKIMEPDELGWLVEQRCAVQRFLLDLHNFGSQAQFGDADPSRAVFEILIGVSYALWRTVFLIDPERQRSEVTNPGIYFLNRLIRDNAVAYTQERNAREWSVGYYLNDAYLRLRLLNEVRVAHGATIPPQQSEPVSAYFGANVARCGVETPLRDNWKTALDVAASVLVELQAGSARSGA